MVDDTEKEIDKDVEENKELYEALADGNDETIDSEEIVATLDENEEEGDDNE
jgi:hypothetical protein